MSNERLKELLSRAAIRMADELKERLIPHNGELGAAREEIVRQFLRANLPKKYEVSSGFVFDANGNISDQLDVIIADTMTCPGFAAAGEARLYPCEAVVAVGQVKTNVTSQRQMWDTFENLRSVCLLDRTANGQAVCSTTGEPIDYENNFRHRIFTFVLILERALGGEIARKLILEVVHRSGPHLWPNVVLALEKYLITYHCDGGVCPNTHDARGISLIETKTFADGIVRLYVYLSQALAVTSVSHLSSFAYLSELLPMGGDTVYSAANREGEPPPLLSSLEMHSWKFPF